MFENKFVNTVLSLFLIGILIYGLIYLPFRKYIPIFSSLGEEESGSLTKLKSDCEQKPTEGCALAVANGTIEAKESPLIAASWIKKEVDFSNDINVLEDAYDITKNKISPALNDTCQPFEIYLPLFEKLSNFRSSKVSEIKAQFNSCGIDIQAIAEGRAIAPPVRYGLG